MSFGILDVYIYTRVSTDEQVKNGGSLDDQELRCKKEIEKHNEEIKGNEDAYEWDLAGVFREEGVSGGTIKKRKQLQHMIETIQEDDIVMLTKIDRLSRKAYDYYKIISDIYNKGARVYLIQTGGFLDDADEYGKLNLGLLVNFAEFERNMIKRRVSEAMDFRRNNDKLTTGALPFGYKMGENKTVELDPPRAEFVKWVFKRYDETRTINQVVREANENPEFLKLKQGRKGVYVKRPEYGNHNIKNILKNKAYTGVYEYLTEKTKEENKKQKKRREEKGKLDTFNPKGPDFTSDTLFEQIIEPELFERVQKQLEKNKGRRESKQHVYLFKGLVWDYSNKKPYKMAGSYFYKYRKKAEREKDKEAGNVVGHREKYYLYKTQYINADGMAEHPENKWVAITEEKLLREVIKQTLEHFDTSKYTMKKKDKKKTGNSQDKAEETKKQISQLEKEFKENKKRFHRGKEVRELYFDDENEYLEVQGNIKDQIEKKEKELLRLEPEKNKEEIERLKQTAKVVQNFCDFIDDRIKKDPKSVNKFWSDIIKRIEIRKIPGKSPNAKGGNKEIKVIFDID